MCWWSCSRLTRTADLTGDPSNARRLRVNIEWSWNFARAPSTKWRSFRDVAPRGTAANRKTWPMLTRETESGAKTIVSVGGKGAMQTNSINGFRAREFDSRILNCAERRVRCGTTPHLDIYQSDVFFFSSSRDKNTSVLSDPPARSRHRAKQLPIRRGRAKLEGVWVGAPHFSALTWDMQSVAKRFIHIFPIEVAPLHVVRKTLPMRSCNNGLWPKPKWHIWGFRCHKCNGRFTINISKLLLHSYLSNKNIAKDRYLYRHFRSWNNHSSDSQLRNNRKRCNFTLNKLFE